MTQHYNTPMPERLANAFVQERAQEAEALSLLRQAHTNDHSWAKRQARRVLSNLGQRLVVWGERLEQVGTRALTPPSDQPTSGQLSQSW
jgi:hypothetical protein